MKGPASPKTPEIGPDPRFRRDQAALGLRHPRRRTGVCGSLVASVSVSESPESFYDDAEVIVFDEPTSALDNLTEHELMKAIDTLSATKTVNMIAHRLSTANKCQRVVRIDAGEIVAVNSSNHLAHTNPE